MNRDEKSFFHVVRADSHRAIQTVSNEFRHVGSLSRRFEEEYRVRPQSGVRLPASPKVLNSWMELGIHSVESLQPDKVLLFDESETGWKPVLSSLRVPNVPNRPPGAG